MDYQKRAAGDQGETVVAPNPFISEMSKRLSESSKRYGHDLDFLEGALDWVINQTKEKMTEDERMQALLKLSTYPKQKIMMISEFNETHFKDIWKYLDTVRVPEQHVSSPKQLPAPHRNIANDLKRVMGLVTGSKDKKEIYAEFMKLHEKYPYSGFNKSAEILGEK